MGTFDHGILDNDCALDGLGDLTSEIVEDIERLGERPGKMSARLMTLLHVGAKEPRFGKREPALFATPWARRSPGAASKPSTRTSRTRTAGVAWLGRGSPSSRPTR